MTPYDERNAVVATLAHMALLNGWKVGTRSHEPETDDWDDDWRNVVFINLPTGQVSWHYHDSDSHLFETLPKYEGSWDGHTTEEKYARLEKFTRTFYKPE